MSFRTPNQKRYPRYKPPKRLPKRRKWRLQSSTTLLITIVAIAGVILIPTIIPFARGCNIKGNISFRGERIYHVPGQKYYNRTIIEFWKGERWFCSEAEAREAGWRRSLE